MRCCLSREPEYHSYHNQAELFSGDISRWAISPPSAVPVKVQGGKANRQTGVLTQSAGRGGGIHCDHGRGEGLKWWTELEWMIHKMRPGVPRPYSQ